MVEPISFILADDDPLYRTLTEEQLKAIPNLTCLGICDSAIAANTLLQNHLPNLLILDIEMPGLTGIQLAKSLTKLPLIIFISSHSHYAADAFEVDAIDYLVKPVSIERLMRAVEKARQLVLMKNTIALHEGFKKEDADAFFIKDKNSFLKINNNEVLFIESLGDFVNIYLKDGQKKIALVSMKNIEAQLPANDFIRVSRTHIVNKLKITSIDATCILLDKLQIQIGKSYADTVLKAVTGSLAIKRYL